MPVTIEELDALALEVRLNAAKYLNAIELVKELIPAPPAENGKEKSRIIVRNGASGPAADMSASDRISAGGTPAAPCTTNGTSEP